MGHDDRREIFERLEALERLVRSRDHDRDDCGDHEHGGRERGCHHSHHHHHHHGHDHHHECQGGDGDFEEKRIIDTIVRLVTEQVGRLVQEQQAQSQRHENGSDEKRIVDLIVALVSEHVREIVATELDRRLGRPEPRPDERAPRGGTPDSEPS